MSSRPATTMKPLSEKGINQILQILDSWRGPLTWDLLLDQVELLMGYRYSRQALWKHEGIRLAFNSKTFFLTEVGSVRPRGSLGIIAAYEQITSLKSKVARLENENQMLKVQFIRWAYNAHKRGLDETLLNHPMPAIDREKSKGGVARKGGKKHEE